MQLYSVPLSLRQARTNPDPLTSPRTPNVQALAERTGAFFVRHATVLHQTTVNNKFGTEQCAALRMLRQHDNAQGVPEERLPLWWAAAEVLETAKAASTPGSAPSFAVNEATTSPNLNWAQQEEGSKYELLSYNWNGSYSKLGTTPASESYPRRWDPFAAPGGLLWLKLMLCAFVAASLVGKSKTKPRR